MSWSKQKEEVTDLVTQEKSKNNALGGLCKTQKHNMDKSMNEPDCISEFFEDLDCCQEQCKTEDCCKEEPENCGICMEMPRYKSHKEVWALKIKKILFSQEETLEVWGYATIIPYEEGYSPFKIDDEFIKKHNPQEGGYFVVYEDGYESYSPAEAFEAGYTKI